jgi:NAD dependent epimerase/dehydratase family enzyme
VEPTGAGTTGEVGAWMMRTDPELALLGRRCVPTRLMREGFEFRLAELETALTESLRT